MADITAIVMTKNESKNIKDCLISIKDLVKRMIVIDCGSTDGTVRIAKELGADVYTHEFEYYAKQYNWGLDNCSIATKWVIRMDADERFPKNLCDEIEYKMKLHSDDDINGFSLESDYFFLGRWLKHGCAIKRKTMVFKYGIGRIEDRKRDAHTILSEGKVICLRNRFLHCDFNGLDNFIKKYNWYATREAYDYMEYINGRVEQTVQDKHIQNIRNKKFRIYYKFPMFLRVWLLFLYELIINKGFFNGRAGIIFCVLEVFWYRYLVDAKIYEYQKLGKQPEKLKALGE